MPELPEVETTRRGIEPHLVKRTVTAAVVRERRLRWPVPRSFETSISGQVINAVRRRAKYLIVDTAAGSALLHLGMSGSLRIVDPTTPLKKHDHVDIALDSGRILRYHDPRRFGSMHWLAPHSSHPLLDELGPEPFDPDFDGAYLHRRAKGRRVSVKVFIMNAKIVVGVGNIYASEALFRAGIDPRRSAGRVSVQRYRALAEAIRSTLGDAIEVGGTTLRDFYGGDGEPGYFRQKLMVYERGDEPCRVCDTPVRRVVLGQRATYFCRQCQR
ncbi:MAG: bifunctional DNA-formamidopyrimidine glycosylase/DNA-(apurinic or apyrimidinic site) lyase [Pseudomonadota bacterium]